MFIFDVESLDVDSTAVVLSFACTHVTEETDSYQKMLDNSIMCKLRIDEQLERGRTTDKGTLQWWDRQSELVKTASLIPNPDIDLSVEESMSILRTWLSKHEFKNDCMFARGMLDPMVLDSICRTFDIKCPVPYNRWYDVRTAIDMMYDGSNYGYIDVEHPTFQTSMVLKHHPVHDCAYDGMMLQYGKK